MGIQRGFLVTSMLGMAALWAFQATYGGQGAQRDREIAAAAAYRTAQAASYHHHLEQAEAGFTRARDLTTDPDKAAWAQYQLASCYSADPAAKARAMPALQRLIHDYPRHFLAARAQADLDRLSGRKPATLAAAPIDTDCGPECLQYLLSRSFHRTVSLAELKKLAGTDEHGTTLLGLQKASLAMGLRAGGMKVDAAYLRHMPQPTICWTRRSHFVAVTATPVTLAPPFWAVRYYDPAGRGEQTVTPDEFSRQWDGYVLTLSDPRPENAGVVDTKAVGSDANSVRPVCGKGAAEAVRS